MATKQVKKENSVVPKELGCTTSTKDSILQVRNLRKHYEVNKALSIFGKDILGKTDLLKAVDNVSFDVAKGKTFGLVGESGCGKTTTGKLILQLENPTAGQIYFQGEDVSQLSSAGMTEYRKSVQAVFQDPWASLNPRMRVRDIVGEPLQIATTMTKDQIEKRVGDLLEEVGLNEYQSNFYPHEFSGGQRQRIGIARALALNPKLIILDEPVSALDVSIRAQIMNLLVDLQNQHDLAYVLIAHNLATVRYMCHKTAVMYLGVIQEMGDTEAVFTNPQHIYTNALMSAALPSHPDIDRDEIVLPGEVVSPINPPEGDVFQTRTPMEVDKKHKYANSRPPLVQVGKKDHWVIETPWSIATKDMKVKLEGK
ncbi:MAG: peptide ABC transporter substrate-binding protein [Chloroflexi bacterium]|nr:peptide ABC transporter substrate-binding protein [Chloroflexota bacterium]|tara:strand:+ start:569 stop:1672 length:1104 start_codon:yes stop_codon:yes gene_type:complete